MAACFVGSDTGRMRKHYTAAQRCELTSLVASGRATPRRAAAQLGVPESTAYYWLRVSGPRASASALVRPRAPARQPQRSSRSRDIPQVFARLVRAADAASRITLRVGGVMLEVQPGFDPALLREVIAALAEATP